MSSRTLLFAALFVLVPLPNAARADSSSIVVFAAASLREAFYASAPAFTKRSGVAVTFNFGGSDMLATQIQQGASADVFASANVAQMKSVSDAGLTTGESQTFARNRLVVIVPKANPARFETLLDLAKPGVKLVLAAPTVPIGGYARAAFAKVAGQASFPADFAAAVERNVVSDELDVKAVATKVALGEADAGVVYATDVGPVQEKVTAFPFPPGTAGDAIYPIAVLKNAPNAAGARAFLEFILSPQGQAFLRARGFLAP